MGEEGSEEETGEVGKQFGMDKGRGKVEAIWGQQVGTEGGD